MELVLKNATIYPVTSAPFKGDLLIEGKKIVEMGENIERPGTETIDLEGKYLFPGFIDAHSHIGLYEEGVGASYGDGNEATDPVTPDVRAIDAFNPYDSAIDCALFGGITTVMIVPGSANPIGGQGAILKFKSKIVDEMIIKEPAGLKMAMGENPRRVYGDQQKTPGTRLGVASVMRNYFTKVKNYIEKKEKAIEKTGGFFETDLKMELGEKVLKGEIPARIHAHRSDDILTAIRISEEFNFRLVIEHASEAYKITDFVYKKNIPIVMGPLFGFRTKLETRGKTYEALKIVNEKGILAAFTCDHPVLPLEHLTIQLGTALRYGSKEEDLLKMITINPAKILGIDNRVGSLEKGKDADLVIWSGHPFNLNSKVEKVYIEGERIL